MMKKPEDLEQERCKKRTGVSYQIVSHLPKSSEQLETRESLANLAVSHGEAYIGTFCSHFQLAIIIILAY